MRFSAQQFLVFALLVILAGGFFLRSYHFSDWLHFELDQARDARVVDDGLRGDFFDLPLLGPKAGGTALRLPPGFYYLEYGSALLFGGTPQGMAMFVMILSTMVIFLSYVFFRRYFSRSFSLVLTLLVAVSEYLVLYGRFAWNPNLIPFFTLLGFYALLRSVEHEESKKGYWFVLAIGALGLAMQFHFLAFLSLPTIVFLFLLIKRPKFSFRVWVCSFLTVSLLYFPMMLNEWETGGANTREFFQAVTKKSGKEQHSLLEKVARNVSEHALYGLVVTTGFEKATFPAISFGDGPLWKCDERCDKGKWYGLTSVFVFLLACVGFLFLWRQENERKKLDFLLLCALWFSVTFILFIPLSYDIAPRFFLLSAPIFFTFLGIVLLFTKKIFGERSLGKYVLSILVSGIVFLNLSGIHERFDEWSRADTEMIKSAPDRILKEHIRVTLTQQRNIVDFLKGRSQETGYPVYMWSEPQHRRALKYLLERQGVENAVLGFDGIYAEGVYYLVLRAQSNREDALKKYRVNYMVGETTSFGTLIVIELFPKTEAIIGKRQDFSMPKPPEAKSSPRYTWREFFSDQQAIDDEDVADDEQGV
ncbi:MAG: glycosyltransferase family 39 protein [Candidatus Moranbacteria bacterium]|nr:glycosyltransferase family 39 protein [Candidatus Moranbacteria bacterium]